MARDQIPSYNDAAFEEGRAATRDRVMSRRDDDEPTIPCPYCRAEIHEDAQQCHRCGNYISAEDAPPPRKPWWVIVGAIACLYAVYRWITG
jgi:hypothetical protein